MCFIPHLGDEQSFFSMKALGININCSQTLKEGKASMSIKATAVVKKETKVDPEKPNDKAYYASLSVLNKDGKEYGLPRYLSSVKSQFCSSVKLELHTNNYMNVLPRTKGAKRSVFL